MSSQVSKSPSDPSHSNSDDKIPPDEESEPNLEARVSVYVEARHLIQDITEDLASTAIQDIDEGHRETPPEAPRPPKKETNAKARPKLSDRMEYLARPKKDFLDEFGFERLDGAVPENAPPTWSALPLQQKLPVGGYPGEITMTNLTTNLFLPPGKNVDTFDPYNRHLPVSAYSSRFDPQMKEYYQNDKMRKNMEERGLISKSGRVIASLRDLNDYREYMRRMQAEKVQQMYRDQYEESKRKRELESKRNIALEEEKTEDKRSQALLRSYIKNAVAFIKDGPTSSAQLERELKVLNRHMRIRQRRKKNAEKQKQREKIFTQHIEYKYGRDSEWKRLAHMVLIEDDLERLNKICKRQKEEQLKRRIKLEDFWSRKTDEQIKWLEKGIELENKWLKDREDKIKDRKALLHQRGMTSGTEISVESRLREEARMKELEQNKGKRKLKEAERKRRETEIELLTDPNVLETSKSFSTDRVTSVQQLSVMSASDNALHFFEDMEKHPRSDIQTLLTSASETGVVEKEPPRSDEETGIQNVSKNHDPRTLAAELVMKLPDNDSVKEAISLKQSEAKGSGVRNSVTDQSPQVPPRNSGFDSTQRRPTIEQMLRAEENMQRKSSEGSTKSRDDSNDVAANLKQSEAEGSDVRTSVTDQSPEKSPRSAQNSGFQSTEQRPTTEQMLKTEENMQRKSSAESTKSRDDSNDATVSLKQSEAKGSVVRNSVTDQSPQAHPSSAQNSSFVSTQRRPTTEQMLRAEENMQRKRSEGSTKSRDDSNDVASNLKQSEAEGSDGWNLVLDQRPETSEKSNDAGLGSTERRPTIEERLRAEENRKRKSSAGLTKPTAEDAEDS